MNFVQTDGFHKICFFFLDFLTRGWDQIGCTETSVQNYQSTLRNIPEKRSFHVHRAGSLKSRKVLFTFKVNKRSLRLINYIIPTNALHCFSVFCRYMFRHFLCHHQGCRREFTIINASNFTGSAETCVGTENAKTV
jgi:hypothetical protein